MMVNFTFANVIFDDLQRFLRNGSYEPDGIRVVKLGTPTMTVNRIINGRPVEISLEQSENFPEIVQADLDQLRNHLITNWKSVAAAYKSGYSAEKAIDAATQEFLNTYYEEEIKNVLVEYDLTLPIVIDEGAVSISYISPLNSMFRKQDGSLFVGTGIPGSKYSIARNDFIELALTSYRRSQWDAGRTMENNTSMLSLASATELWSITWSVGSTHEEITDITQMYDVDLIIYANGNGLKENGLVWRLIRDEAAVSKYALQLTTNVGTPVPNVVDSKGDAEFRCVQNSTRLDWFRPVVVPAIAAPNAIEGTYVAELRAVHKVTRKVISIEHITEVDYLGNN